MTEELAEVVEALDRLPPDEQREIAARLNTELYAPVPVFALPPETERTPGADWP